MLKRCIALFVLLHLLSTATAVADVVIATETGRGEYENGRFTPGKPEFRYRFELDEAAGRAKLTEITRLNTGALIQLSVDYVIIAAEDASATSSILVEQGQTRPEDPYARWKAGEPGYRDDPSRREVFRIFEGVFWTFLPGYR